MKFELGIYSFEFDNGADYPAKRRIEILQITDRTAAGILKTEILGVQLRSRTLNFNMMSSHDYDGLLDWFINKANGSENSFTFTDEYDYVGDVKFIDNIVDFDETSLGLYSGSITVEYV